MAPQVRALFAGDLDGSDADGTVKARSCVLSTPHSCVLTSRVLPGNARSAYQPPIRLCLQLRVL